jgi:hypothetical protein
MRSFLRRFYRFVWLLALATGLTACAPSASEPRPDAAAHPRFLVGPEDRPRLLARLDREPYRTLIARLEDEAARDWAPEPGEWNASVWSRHAGIAQANAFLAWLRNDPAKAARARELMLAIDPDWDSNTHLDINIRMPGVLIPWVNALDLLAGTPWLDAAAAYEIESRIVSVTRQFAGRFLDNAIYRGVARQITQNNHPIRTAAAIGYVGLAFPHDPDAARWLNWAISDIAHLLSERGAYLQPDGGVSEGPFYAQFGLAAAWPLLIAVDRTLPADHLFRRDCLSRIEVDPFGGHGCVDGESFRLDNPLRTPLLRRTLDWLVALRLPNGNRAYINDAKHVSLVAGAILTGFGGEGYLSWDWQTHPESPTETSRFFPSAVWTLAYVDDATAATPPSWRNRFFPDTGHAVFRTGWGDDDHWLAVVADAGAARKTLHNHGDGASFTYYAYGEPLLIDTGYYKPDPMQNPLTMNPPSHNVILVDGTGGPDRGLLLEWGDVDAQLGEFTDHPDIAWVEARKEFADIALRRGVAFVRGRYVIVADRIDDRQVVPRSFAWRAHPWAGYDAAGTWSVAGTRFELVQTRAGLHMAVTSTAGAPAWQLPPYTRLQPPHVHQLFENEELAGDHVVADATIVAADPSFLAVLAPWSTTAPTGSAQAPLAVTAVAAGPDAAAWLISGDGWQDLAWLRKPGAAAALTLPGGVTVTTDARVVIMAVDGRFALVADGATVSRNGRALFSDDHASLKVTP